MLSNVLSSAVVTAQVIMVGKPITNRAKIVWASIVWFLVHLGLVVV